MATANELLKQATVRIQELLDENDKLTICLGQYQEANMLLAKEADLVKQAFKMVEYNISPPHESYEEALEKAASFQDQHGDGALAPLEKQAEYNKFGFSDNAPSLGKAAEQPQHSQTNYLKSLNAEQRYYLEMVDSANNR